MNRFFLIAALSLFAGNLYAQYNQYKLSNYINPDYHYRSLDFSLNGDGAADATKNTSNNYEITDTDSYITGKGGLSFLNHKNTLTSQAEHHLSLNFSGNYQYQKSSTGSSSSFEETAKAGNIEPTFLYNGNIRYYDARKRFIEISPMLNAGLQFSKQQQVNSSTDENKTTNNRNTSMSFSIGVGTGRIEEVSDARTAVYILEDLHKRGVMKQILSDEEVSTFAGELTKLANQRSFDNRIKLMEDITAIDSFLVSHGYVEKGNAAAYYTSLYDNWLYSRTITRNSGSRFSIGVTPFFSYGYGSEKQTTTSGILNNIEIEGEHYQASGSFYLSYTYEKPINLYWQTAVGANIQSGWGWTEIWNEILGFTNANTISYTDYTINFRAYYSLGFYPNSRTSIKGSIGEYIGWKDDHDIATTFFSHSFLDFDMNYYFSPQFRMQFNVGLNYRYAQVNADIINNNQKFYDKYPLPYFSLGIVYKII